MRMLGARLGVVMLCLLLPLPACRSGPPASLRLRVLASPELADMQPLLDELRRETGVKLVLEYRAGVDTDPLPAAGHSYDFAWLASGGHLKLRLRSPEYTGTRPLSTATMLSPVVVGVTPKAAARLREAVQGAPLSWADIADGAAAGTLRFAMPDPKLSGSGLAALVGVATAAAGTGAALRPQDVTCDRLRGFLTGQTLTEPTSTGLTDEFVRHQDDVDALIGEESALLALNDSGKLREKLEIIYPADGIVQAEHPLVLLNPAQREAYDRVVTWLKSKPAQQRITEQTLRRPVDPDVPRDASAARIRWYRSLLSGSARGGRQAAGGLRRSRAAPCGPGDFRPRLLRLHERRADRRAAGHVRRPQRRRPVPDRASSSGSTEARHSPSSGSADGFSASATSPSMTSTTWTPCATSSRSMTSMPLRLCGRRWTTPIAKPPPSPRPTPDELSPSCS